jgi:hypothetical protein
MESNNGRKLNIHEKILAAAYELPSNNFSLEELIVACWKKWPDTFGLVEFNYPDSNIVSAALSKREGVIRRGWFERVAPKTYIITDCGRSKIKGD